MTFIAHTSHTSSSADHTAYAVDCSGDGCRNGGTARHRVNRRRRFAKRPGRSGARALVLCAAAATVLGATGCGQSNSKSYDISPIFPASADKCARYGGTSDGTGLAAHCWVTKAECLRAAQDWSTAMAQGGVTDAIEFKC